VKNTSYEAPHYVVFSNRPHYSSDWGPHILLMPCSQTPSIYVRPLV